MNEPTELYQARGYDYTHWDCPFCSEANEDEGDIKGETVECPNCGATCFIE